MPTTTRRLKQLEEVQQTHVRLIQEQSGLVHSLVGERDALLDALATMIVPAPGSVTDRDRVRATLQELVRR